MKFILSLSLVLGLFSTLSAQEANDKKAAEKPAKAKLWMSGDEPIQDMIDDNKGKNVLFMFGADWCIISERVKAHFNDASIQKLIKEHKIKLVYMNCTDDGLARKELMEFTGRIGTPTLLLQNKKGIKTHNNVKQLYGVDKLAKLLKESFKKEIEVD